MFRNSSFKISSFKSGENDICHDALVAMDMPGPGTLFLSQNWKFTAPVFIGDTITAEVEVLKLHESKPVTQLGIVIRRQDGQIVLEGEAWCFSFSPSKTS